MKTFRLIWIIVAMVLYLVGTVWYYIVRNKEGQQKAPMYIKAIGLILMGAYFIFLLIRR